MSKGTKRYSESGFFSSIFILHVKIKCCDGISHWHKRYTEFLLIVGKLGSCRGDREEITVKSGRKLDQESTYVKKNFLLKKQTISLIAITIIFFPFLPQK